MHSSIRQVRKLGSGLRLLGHYNKLGHKLIIKSPSGWELLQLEKTMTNIKHNAIQSLTVHTNSTNTTRMCYTSYTPNVLLFVVHSEWNNEQCLSYTQNETMSGSQPACMHPTEKLSYVISCTHWSERWTGQYLVVALLVSKQPEA